MNRRDMLRGAAGAVATGMVTQSAPVSNPARGQNRAIPMPKIQENINLRNQLGEPSRDPYACLSQETIQHIHELEESRPDIPLLHDTFNSHFAVLRSVKPAVKERWVRQEQLARLAERERIEDKIYDILVNAGVDKAMIRLQTSAKRNLRAWTLRSLLS